MRVPQQAEHYRREGWWRPETLVHRFNATCADNIDRPVIIDGDQQLSFGDVASRVWRLAGHFARLGVRPGDVVSWQLPNWWEAAIVHYAALRAGAIPNPLNPIFRARELRF